MMSPDYTAKMDKLCTRLGWDLLAELCPLPLAEIRRTLDAGDEYLNKWGNGPWDRVSLCLRDDAPRTIECCTCGHARPNPDHPKTRTPLSDRMNETSGQRPWYYARGLSLSERNGALKHAARGAARALTTPYQDRIKNECREAMDKLPPTTPG